MINDTWWHHFVKEINYVMTKYNKLKSVGHCLMHLLPRKVEGYINTRKIFDQWNET
jgi:hypothetical protein